MTPRTLALSLATLFAFSAVAFATPAVDAQPCNTAGCCGLSLCTCTLCQIVPIVTSCHAVSEGSPNTVSVAYSTCTDSGSAFVCTSPTIYRPVDPKSLPAVGPCQAGTTLVLP